MELDFNYSSVAGIVAAAEQAGLPISRLVLNQQALHPGTAMEEPP